MDKPKYSCSCAKPTPSNQMVFGAVMCARCKMPIEAIGQKGCGDE